ncbi:MAG: hypothetical protein BGP01_07155 [Paludibacter sp. 47-17]|nr:MAG: hypothetical protein BGP01_07155 [Paludibacter sp. 47-17]
MNIIRKLLGGILMLYSGYLLIRCLIVFKNLTEYGSGVLVGALLIMALGIFLFFYTPKTFKKK